MEGLSMARKRKRRKGGYPPKEFYLYVNEDGSQHLPDGIDQYQQITEIPEDVDEFYFKLRIQIAADAVNATTSVNALMFALQDDSRLSDDAKARKNADESMKLTLATLVNVISEWNEVDENDKPVPITVESLLTLEPRWLFEAIVGANTRLNTGKNWNRG